MVLKVGFMTVLSVIMSSISSRLTRKLTKNATQSSKNISHITSKIFSNKLVDGFMVLILVRQSTTEFVRS